MFEALRRHWPEYLFEALGLGLFTLSAALFGTWLEHPGSPLRATLPDATTRRLLMGGAMGLTAIGIIYSPFGRRSGAHLNPAVTFTFWRLGKIAGADAVWYGLAQFAGGLLGLLIGALIVGEALRAPSVNWVATLPGKNGVGIAFLAEALISFLLMGVVLVTANTQRLAPFTGLFAGILICTYIAIEAPLSGMSMNPARTLASAVPASLFTGLWIYFTAPLLGMGLAAELYRGVRGARRVACAKLHHDHRYRCIFRCGYHG
jgi:aquaporin Z